MTEMVIGTIMMVIVAAIAAFLILIAINIALFLILRSSIPQKPFSDSEHVTEHAYTRDDR
jgi:high-affinity Fe2+/Pb2+ permease